ncbi:L-amino acid N-acyltransferase YncA [Chitinophaga jiangningensis]|uniref:L-amino acid N-acyltransferase YncA n=1 Tax=Chitinophaga jiangningensis TaxID=1419482 RepID=A0A1M7LQH3_9BACT|nr:GNAT family N-acetyltransferase [Chitinophaga jiangningensis]SHM80362.1 L-amino acid N-acyltransferase YncA [Chitinophaga jiangningensis]
MAYTFRQATRNDIPVIWTILQQAILRRKADGSEQWQDGYPNQAVVQQDIANGYGYVLTEGDTILGYTAVMINNEPAYADIQGKWLTDGDFVVYHRVAIDEGQLGKGLAQAMLKEIEGWALRHNVHSVRADTNFDNPGMLKIFEKLGYSYCGEVFFRGSARKAFEKVLP